MTTPEYRIITERYCPVVGCNVPMYLFYRGETAWENCLQEHLCHQERGGCQNRITRQFVPSETNSASPHWEPAKG